MRWLVHHGDILDVDADILVCSANVYLNLSGGVGGAFLLRYGPAMQDALHAHLADKGVRHLNRGDVVPMPPCGSPYRAVLHAIAVDGCYEPSAKVVEGVIRESLRKAAKLRGRVVALTAVGTGYGRLSIADFAEGLRNVMGEDFTPIERLVVGLRSRDDVDELCGLIPQIERAIDLT